MKISCTILVFALVSNVMCSVIGGTYAFHLNNNSTLLNQCEASQYQWDKVDTIVFPSSTNTNTEYIHIHCKNSVGVVFTSIASFSLLGIIALFIYECQSGFVFKKVKFF